MLHKIIFWLQQRRLVNLLLVFAYTGFIVFMHHPMVLLSVWVEKNLSIKTYNGLVAVVVIAVLLGVFVYLAKQFSKHKENATLKLFYLFSTMLLFAVHSQFMLDSNIEMIHAFEYSILAVLIFPLTKRFGATIFFTLPFMLIDEWYQYTILYPKYDTYFDLNDILMDTYGAALTMLALMMAGVKGNENIKPLYLRPEFIFWITGIALVLCLVQAGIIAPYQNNVTGSTWLLINENNLTEPFWRFHPTHHIWYHAMKPAEGLMAIAALHFFYFGLDSLRITKFQPSTFG